MLVTKYLLVIAIANAYPSMGVGRTYSSKADCDAAGRAVVSTFREHRLPGKEPKWSCKPVRVNRDDR